MAWYDDVDWDAVAAEDARRQAQGLTDADRERIRRWNPENDSNFVMDTARDIGRGAIQVADSLVGLGDMAYNAVTGGSFRPELRELGWTPDEWDREIALRNSFARQDADAAVEGAKGLDAVGAYLSNPRALGGALAQQIPMLAGMIGGAAKAARAAEAMGRLSPKAAAIAGAALTEGGFAGGSVASAVGDRYAETGEDPGRRIAAAGAGAGAGTALIGAAMGPLGGAVEASIGSRLAGRGFANALSRTAPRRLARSVLGEGTEEALQSGQEQIWQNYGTGDPWSTDVGTQMAVGGLLGGVIGGALHPFTGPSSSSQKNLMPGANATGEEQRTAETVAEERAVYQAAQERINAAREHADYLARREAALSAQGDNGAINIERQRPTSYYGRQFQAETGVAGRPMQAIPTDVAGMQAAVNGGIPTAMAAGYVQAPLQVGSVSPYPAPTQAPQRQVPSVPTVQFSDGQAVAVNNPNDMTWTAMQHTPGAEIQLENDLPEQLPRQQPREVPKDFMGMARALNYGSETFADDIDTKKIELSGMKDANGKTMKPSVRQAFASLNSAQRTFVLGSMAARKAIGSEASAADVAHDIKTAVDYIPEDSIEVMQKVVDGLAAQPHTAQRTNDYYKALSEALGSNPKDPSLTGMSFAHRFLEVSKGIDTAPAQAAAPAAPAQTVKTDLTLADVEQADQTPTRQSQAEQTPPQQEAVSTAPVAAQKAEAKPTRASKKKAIPDSVQEMEEAKAKPAKKNETPKEEKPKLSERPADAVPAALATTKAARQRDAQAKRRKEMSNKVLEARHQRKTETSENEDTATSKEDEPKPMASMAPKKNRFAKVEGRSYTDEQKKEYDKRYRKISETENKLTGDERKISDGDKVSGNTIKSILNDFLEGTSLRMPKEIVESFYNWLTPESLEFVRHAVENNATTQGGNAFDHIRWMANVLDEAVKQKEAGNKELELDISDSELNRVNASAEDRQITAYVGTPSLHMTSPTAVYAEFFDTPEYRDAPQPLTANNLVTAGVAPGKGSKKVNAVLRRAKQTIAGLKGGTLQLMVPSDDSGGWGQTVKGVAKPMLRVVRKAVKTGHKGWKNLTYENGDKVGAADQAVIFERALWLDLARRMESANEEADYDIPAEIRDSFPTNSDIELETSRFAADFDESDSAVADGVSLSVNANTMLEESNRTALEAAQETLADHLANKNTKLDVLAADIKALVPLLLRSEILSTFTTEVVGKKRKLKSRRIPIELKHPIRRFLNNPKEIGAIIYGFSGAAMYEPTSAREGVKLEDLEYILLQGGTFKPRPKEEKRTIEDQVVLRGASTTSTNVLGAWRRTAASIGGMIGRLNRPIEDRNTLIKSLSDFVRKDLLPAVPIPDVTAKSTPKDLLDNRFYTELDELRADVANAFTRSMQATMSQTNRLKLRWADRVGAKNTLFNNKGTGLIASDSAEDKALRAQFKEFVADYFQEKTGNGFNLRRLAPLNDRIAVYDSLLKELTLSLAWTSPTTAGREQFPNGRFEFTRDLNAGEDTVKDFDPADLWIGQWVKASGLFTQEELEGSKKHYDRSRGKGDLKEDLTGVPGSAELYNRMKEAQDSYAAKIHYGSMYGVGDEALAAASDAVITRNELKVPQREHFIAAEQEIESFLEANSTTARIEDSHDEFFNVMEDYIKAIIRYDRVASLTPELEQIRDGMSAEEAQAVMSRNEARTKALNDMVDQANEAQYNAYNKLEALTENLVKTTVKKRGEVKAQLMDLATNYVVAWEALNGDLYEAQLRQTQSMIEEGKRLGLNKEAINAIWRDRMEDRRYYDSQMSELDDETLADAWENGSKEEIAALSLARDIVDNIARAVTFFQAHGEMQTSHYALAEISNRIQEGLNSEALKGQGTLFTDALAAYLKRHYVRFANELNEEAKRLNAEMRQELEDSGFDPDTDPKVKAAYDKWQDLKDQWFDASADSAEANQLYEDVLTASDDYWAARDQVFRKELRKRGFTEVFNENSQKLSIPTQVEVHKRAVNAVTISAHKSKRSPKQQQRIDRVLARVDPTVTPETAQDKDAFMDAVIATVPTTSVFDALKGRGVSGQNMRVLKVLVNQLQRALGNRIANKFLSKVNIGFYKPRFGVVGLYFRLNGAPTIWINDNATDLADATHTFTHELTHAVFDVLGAKGLYKSEEFDYINRRHTGTYEPVGKLAKEIKYLNDRYQKFFDLLHYPLDTINEFTYPRLNSELLAQIGSVWLSSAENRERIQREAPNLHRIFATYFLGGKGDEPSKSTGRPLARLDRKNSETKTGNTSRSEATGRESDFLRSRRGESIGSSGRSGGSVGAESTYGSGVLNPEQKMDGGARSKQPTSQSSRAETRSSTNAGRTQRDAEAQYSERWKLVDSANKEAARIANPEPSFIQRVINRLPAERRQLAQAVADTAAGWFGDYGVSKFLGALFTTDLARMVKKVMPSIQKWIDKKKERDAWINTRQQELGHYRQRFNELPKDVQDKLNTLWADTTLSGIWIAKPAWANATQWAYMQDEGDKATRISLTADYNKLPPEAQRLYNDVLQYGHDSMVLKNTLLAEKANEYLRTLEESSKDAEELQDLKDSLKATLQLAQDRIKVFNKPYVPLLRRGSHVVVARSQELINLQNEREELRKQRREDREWTDDAKERLKEVNKQILKLEQSQSDYVVSFVDSQAQANRLATELRKDFNGHVEAFPREEIGRMQSVSLGTIHELENQLAKRLDDEDAPSARKMIRKMVNVLNEMYTMNLSDYHANKNQLRRLKVAGFDKNMMNNFLDNGYRETLFYGNVKFQREIQDALRDMRNESNITGGNVSREVRKRVLNEVMKREQLDYDYKPNEVFEKAQRMTSVMMLLTSPAFYLQNMTQPFMMTCPWLAHDFSGSRVFKDMADNTKKMIQAYFNKGYRSGIEIDFEKVPWMSKALREGLEIARSRGLIDIGISQDFGQLNASSKFQELTDYLSRGARVIEMVNRVASFTTAFNLKYEQEKAKGNKDAVQAATDYACDAIYATHGDYSATNEPRYFKRGGLGLGGAEKLIFQFRKFQLIQIGMVMRMAKEAFAGASPEARAAGRRAFAYMLGTHFTMAGVAGTPLVTTLAFILNGIFGDDDDTAEDTMRKWIGDKEMSDLLIRGLPAYLGVDVSERVGAANMFSPFPYLNATPLSGREGALETIAAMGGPFVSQFVRMSNGIGYMSEGDMYKGVEMMLPNGLTNAMRAYRYATEGYTTKNGTVTIPSDEYGAMETFFQALGLPTMVTTERYRLQDKLIRTEDRFSREERRINKEYREATNSVERRAAMREWVALQKERAAAGFKPKPVTQLQKNEDRVEKDAKNAIGGLVVNNSNRGFVQYWSNL